MSSQFPRKQYQKHELGFLRGTIEKYTFFNCANISKTHCVLQEDNFIEFYVTVYV